MCGVQELQLELKDIISCNFMVNNCYLVAISTDNSICIFDLREPPERNKVSISYHFHITCIFIYIRK
jgi:hypothetical protein